MRNQLITLMGVVYLLLSSPAYSQPCTGNLINIYGLCANISMSCTPSTVTPGDYTYASSANLSSDVLLHREVHLYVNTNISSSCSGLINISNTYVDFNDGQGVQLVTSNPVIYQYSTGGSKTITIQVETNEGMMTVNKNVRIEENIQGGTTYEYESPDAIWELESEDYTASCTNVFPSGNSYNLTGKGHGSAYIKYANPSNPVLTNPVIFVDGIDFTSDKKYYDPNRNNAIIRHGATGWDVMSKGLMKHAEVQLFQEMPVQIQSFQSNGYDLIFLDFHDGVDYIQRNALVLEELLDSINAVKDCNGDEIVVIGASMGGQIARYALAKMENEGRYHGVRTYVSFDSPHQGAVVPMGVQAALWGLAHLPPSDDISPDAQALWERLNTPATYQLLYDNFLGAAKNGDITPSVSLVKLHDDEIDTIEFTSISSLSLNYNCLRNQFVSERTALGYPQKARNVAIANGSKLALNQGFPLSGTLVNVKSNQLWGKAFNVFIASADQTDIARVKVPVDYNVLWGILGVNIPDEFHLVEVENQNLIPYDNAPGCMQTFTGLLSDEMAKDSRLGIIGTTQETHCFMPTISTLDINTNSLNINVFNLNPVLNNLTPFEAYYAPDTNEYHVQITAPLRAWLNNELTTNDREMPNTLTSIYNLGGLRKYAHTTVVSGGILGFNDTDYAIGFANSGNPVPSQGHTSYINGCGVTIENGGTMTVGTATLAYPTEVRVVSGSTLHIKSGGIVRIKGYSQLIIEEGATLIIEEGGMINYWGDNTDNAPVVYVKGNMVIPNTGGGTEAVLIGAGRLHIAPTGLIDIQAFATLMLEGTDETKTIMELGYHVDFNVNDKAKLILTEGAVKYNDYASIRANIGSSLIISKSRLEGSVGHSSIGIESDGATIVKLNQVDIHNMSIGLHLYNGLGNNVLSFIDNCNFFDCAQGIVAMDQNVLKSINNSFSGNTDVAISANHVEYLHIAHNTINAHNYGVLLYDVPVCKIMDTQIDNCDYGIFAQHKSNVFLSDQTIMSRNQTAIHLVGDADDGMVSMNCATLDSNVVGISGTDVLLDIDAEIHAFDSTQISPNVFKNILPNGLLFDICYEQRNISTIYAKGNYWDGMTTLPHYLYYHLYYTPGGGSCPSNTSNVTLDLSNAYITEPSGCNFGHPGGAPSHPYTTVQHLAAPIQRLSNQCAISYNSHNYDVARQYKLGDERFKTDDFVEADLKYAPVSALNGNTRDNASDACRHYIDVAEVMVKVEEILKSHRSSQHTTRSIDALWSLWDTSAIVPRATRSSAQYCDLSTYPNPAADLLTLTIKGDHLSGQGTVTMYNAFGQVVKTYTLNGTHSEIPLYELSPGLYRLTYFSAVDNVIGETNVVVH